jgi:hypothetical protein
MDQWPLNDEAWKSARLKLAHQSKEVTCVPLSQLLHELVKPLKKALGKAYKHKTHTRKPQAQELWQPQWHSEPRDQGLCDILSSRHRKGAS